MNTSNRLNTSGFRFTATTFSNRFKLQPCSYLETELEKASSTTFSTISSTNLSVATCFAPQTPAHQLLGRRS